MADSETTKFKWDDDLGIIPARLKLLCEQQNHRCCYCGARFRDNGRRSHPNAPTVEHVHRRADGGLDTWENLAAACYVCNSARGVRDAEEFYEFVKAGGLAGMKVAAINAFEKRKGYIPWWKQRVAEPEIVPITRNRQAYFDLVYGSWARRI